MRWSSVLACALAGLLCLAVAGGTLAVHAAIVEQGTDQVGVDADDIVMEVDVQDDGDAHWQIQHRIRLEDQAEIDAFEELRGEIDDDPANFTERFRDRIEPTVADAAQATGRDMAVENVSIATDRRFIEREYGIVTYSYTWTGFAGVDEADLHVGDALAGTFLTEETSLVITWQEDYAVDEVRPDPDDDTASSVRWSGPREFADDEPHLVVTGDEPDDDPGGLPTWLALPALLAILVAAGGGWWYVSRDRPPTEPTTTAEEANPEADEAPLLSNEERVLHLLEERGGRMKQQEVAEELDWTATKTSKVVGNLREDDELESFRLGRENVLRLPEVDESPLE